ncbi:amidohydrolase family protein [Pontibacter sp. 172403-2]|uniref:amidohydrolase family protein n=1 Tax=Pontibacter rufus TaxID=2791028 RepID=UPI0018B01679|nr:amidohydrolase family protein [Pontibacter sp. 172403-2]MBF9254918.1 amidohydrolase family protein [Pontibacter sp. 172403-2]
MKIDAHQHFWKFDPVRDNWITEEMPAIRKDFLPEDLQPLLQQNGFDGCVLVQSAEPETENEFLLELAQQHDFIKGVVGWIELQAADIEDTLAYYSRFDKLKGFRYVLQGHSNKALMLEPEFKNGIRKLARYGYTYDILIFPDQLAYTQSFVAAFPDQPFVIDHLAKPRIKDNGYDAWKQRIRAFAGYENVYCKVSGMVTEANWKGWKKEDFSRYLDTLVDTFGTERLLYGSDWPVCLLAATYEEMLGIVTDYFSSFSQAEQAKLFGRNAASFYHLS